MGSEWSEFSIDDLKAPVKGAIAMGPFGSRIKAENFVGEGVPVIKGGQLHGAYVLDSGFDYLTEEKAEELKTSQAVRGDLVITHRGTIGQVSIIPDDSKYEKYIVSQSQLKVSLDPSRINPYFVNYFFRSHIGQHRLLVNASQVGVPAIAKASTSVKEIMVPCPNLAEQNKIVHTLQSLDDRIELNRQMNETLESMAQALFKSWFVDFDPVIDNALASGKEIPEELREKAQARAALGDKRQPLPAEIRSLFPDEFVYSDALGWIPEGWETRAIDEAIEINPRIKLKKKEIAKFVDMKALPTTGFSVAGIIEKPYAGGAKFNTGDVLLARITPCLENGKTGVVDFLEEGEVGFGSTEFIVLRGKGAIQTPFVACLARDPNFRRHCIQSMVGSSGRQRVQNACFSYFHLALPPEDDPLRAFNKTAEGIFEKYVQHREQSEVLVSLRDTLLPKLLSGEIRIPDAEKMVEELAL